MRLIVPIYLETMMNDINIIGGKKNIMQSIKTYRSSTGAGLVEAKWAIENWFSVQSFIVSNGRMPRFTGSYPNFIIS